MLNHINVSCCKVTKPTTIVFNPQISFQTVKEHLTGMGTTLINMYNISLLHTVTHKYTNCYGSESQQHI